MKESQQGSQESPEEGLVTLVLKRRPCGGDAMAVFRFLSDRKGMPLVVRDCEGKSRDLGTNGRFPTEPSACPVGSEFSGSLSSNRTVWGENVIGKVRMELNDLQGPL